MVSCLVVSCLVCRSSSDCSVVCHSDGNINQQEVAHINVDATCVEDLYRPRSENGAAAAPSRLCERGHYHPVEQQQGDGDGDGR